MDALSIVLDRSNHPVKLGSYMMTTSQLVLKLTTYRKEVRAKEVQSGAPTTYGDFDSYDC